MVSKYLLGFAAAFATFLAVCPADAQVRYQGTFTGPAAQVFAFDFTRPMFITSDLFISAAEANCTATVSTCSSLSFSSHQPAISGGGLKDVLVINTQGIANRGSFLDGAFASFGTYVPQDRTDNLQGSLIVSDASVVVAAPEPATWGLMIGGFGVVGGTLRRRRRLTSGHLAAV